MVCLKILYIINPGSGNHSTEWPKEIEEYFRLLNYSIELYFQVYGEFLGQVNDIESISIPAAIEIIVSVAN